MSSPTSVTPLRPRRRSRRLLGGAVLALGALVGAGLPALPALAATSVKVNFQPASMPVPTGFTADTGAAYSATAGSGWIDLNDDNPEDMTANTRDGWSAAGGWTSLMQMQSRSNTTGVVTSARWKYLLANGNYQVTVKVGDGRFSSGTTYCCLDSTDRITVNGVLVVNDFVPSSAAPFDTESAVVAVTDGTLVVDPTGGINTKMDQITITPTTATPAPPAPQVTGVTPAQGATQVALNSSVSLAVSAPVDPTTISASTFMLTDPHGTLVGGNYNSDAAGGTASFTPSANLAVNTTYTVTVTSGLKSTSGVGFAPFTSQFTTGTAPPPLASTAFNRGASVNVAKPNVMTFGPDGKLYVGTEFGGLYRYTVGSDGTLTGAEQLYVFGTRPINGLAFDPTNPQLLWITNTYSGFSDAPPMSGHISTLTIQPGQPLSADASSLTDVIVGLPRSMHDHMTNGLAFGPDGKLYIAQGANTAYGDTDSYWGPRGEAPMSASILVADVHNTALFPAGQTIDVNTDPAGTTEPTGSDAPVGYDPKAADAPVTVYAYGIRNPYTLLWHSNGSLYAPVNESAAGGNTPAGPGNNPPAALNVQAYTDYFTRVQAGKYYGHPNPAQGYYTLNGGNPTAAGDPYEVTEYPVGVQPDPNWQAPDFAMGLHRSPDGAAEYTSSKAFGGALEGKVLVSEYSDGDDIVAVSLDSSGKPVSEAALPDAANSGQSLIFNNPLGLAVSPTTGDVYVAEHGDETSSTTGDIQLLTPATTQSGSTGTTATAVHVNFQPASVTAPTGYSADTGAAFNGTQGWQDLSGNPLDLTANTRVRHSASSPDLRYDTQILMQAPSGSGNTTPGRWVTSLPNGQYDVTVGVGDSTATNSVDEIVAQPGTSDATTIVDKFVPTASAYFDTVTKRVTVSSGQLVLSPTGGSNTKLDFVDAVPAAADTVAPTVSLSLAGTLASGSTTAYQSAVTVTATASDNVGVTSETYVLDGATAKSYTGPVSVTAVGSHTITVTAKDAAGNPGTATATFSITSTAPTSLHVNFAPAGTAAPSGYVNDTGAAFSSASGSGWETLGGAPLDMTGNTRVRNSSLSPDKRYDSLVQMQELTAAYGGTATPGMWQHALANGQYDVTVAVGDATATNSDDVITAEPGTADAVTVVDHFQATSSTLFDTVTKRVTVSDGYLTLDPTGGSNTKIDFVDAVPAASDTAPPTVSLALTGSLVSSPSTYQGQVTVTANSTDNVGVTSTSYVLDGGASAAYTGPVSVTGVGSHTIVVSASDAAGNVGSASATFTISSSAPTSAHVDFGAQTSTPVSGYVLDYGQAYSTAAGFGWENAGTGAATSLVGNGRDRSSSLSPDKRYDHFVQMQEATSAYGGTTTPGQWEYALANGTYSVTVAVGDPSNTDSTHVLTAEPGTANSVVLIDHFVPKTGALFQTVTKNVTVSDGRLTISPTGGTNTKIDFIDVVPATGGSTDTTAPTASISLSGTSDGSGGYVGTVTATVSAADEAGGSGLASVTYSLDGGAYTAYSSPIAVSASGSHTLAVKATDNAGNVGTASKSWTSSSADTTAPTATITLSGTQYSGSTYSGDVTATVSASDNTGGSGLASVTYSLDGGATKTYTAPVVVSTVGSHTLTVQATDNQGNVGTATKSWSQVAPDTTAPTVSIALSGTSDGSGGYLGSVTATVTAADESGGSGLASVTYSLDGAAAKAYTAPIVVTAAGSHTLSVVAKDNAGNSNSSQNASWTQASGTAHLTVTSPDDAVLGTGSGKLIFSAVRTFAAPAPRAFTFTNTGNSALTVSNLAIGGTNASDWSLAAGQPTSVTIPAGGTAQVSLQFKPADPTGCPDSTNTTAISPNVNRSATLTFSSTDSSQPTGSMPLQGTVSCYVGGNNEPVLDQILTGLGYTDNVYNGYDRRFIGPLRWLGNDEIQSPYFVAADSSKPVSLVPIAHYGSGNTSGSYQSTGWYAKGSTMGTNSVCSSACKTLFQFPADTKDSSGNVVYNQNQKLLPSIAGGGTTTFTPSGAFGLFSSDYSEVNFSDDSLNTAHTTSNVNMPAASMHYLHQMRVYPAYGPGHVLIPNTYIVGDDLSRVPPYKNNDYQDVVLLLTNAAPAVAQGPVVSGSSLTDNLTAGGTVSGSCAVTGFDGVLPNTAGDQCNAANIAFANGGLTLTSSAGQLANNNQQNALYKSFDATRGAFTVDAQVKGPASYISSDYQQFGAWFGPDQANFFKVEIDSNGSAPHASLLIREKGSTLPESTVALPAVTTASTIDLIIKGNYTLPDPVPFGDTYGVHGFPLSELTAWYSIDGGTPVQIGSGYYQPGDVTGWFSRMAKAGILTSNSGSTTTISPTFTKFAITAP